jgi:ABC-type glutathione transport system ATPase component
MESAGTTPAALEAEHVSIHYVRRRHRTLAVNDVTLRVASGETVGLVGESGSGKTSLARAALGLVKPSTGHIRVNGRDVAYRRGRPTITGEVQAVFQSPFSSLDPAQRVGQILAEPLAHLHLSRTETQARIHTALHEVGLDPSAAQRVPGQFSGGQRQRIAVARATIGNPRLIICDEPTSALDLSIQAQVINLLMDIRERHGVSYLFIGHDIGVVRHLSSRIYVMYRGQVVEHGPAADICDRPSHPYTQRLLAAEPVPDPVEQRARRARRRQLSGVSSLADTPSRQQPTIASSPSEHLLASSEKSVSTAKKAGPRP